MIEVRVTDEFTEWFEGLRDARAVHAITARLTRLSYGLMGDVARSARGSAKPASITGPASGSISSDGATF